MINGNVVVRGFKSLKVVITRGYHQLRPWGYRVPICRMGTVDFVDMVLSSKPVVSMRLIADDFIGMALESEDFIPMKNYSDNFINMKVSTT